MEIIDTNAKDVWIKAINKIIANGTQYIDNESRSCQELNNLSITILDPKTIKEPIDLMLRTNKWIYPSKEELTNIMFKEQQAPVYEYTYGGRIFSFSQKINQIEEFILPLLAKDSQSRRAVIGIYNPERDSTVLNKNTPGMLYIQFLIRNNKLNLYAMIRSNDVFFGFPANAYQLYCLQEFVAKRLNIELGSMTITSTSAHIFLDDSSSLEEITGIKLNSKI